MKIAAPMQVAPADPTEAAKAAKKDEEIKKVGRDFEAIFVRQMLSQTKIAGKGGYADMAVESLSTSIANGSPSFNSATSASSAAVSATVIRSYSIGGSFSTTSRAAPANCPLSSATANAASSISGPRPVLTM